VPLQGRPEGRCHARNASRSDAGGHAAFAACMRVDAFNHLRVTRPNRREAPALDVFIDADFGGRPPGEGFCPGGTE